MLQVAAFEPRRGLALTVCASELLRAKLGNVEFAVVGDTNASLPDPPHVPSFVRLLGRVTDAELATLYGAAEIVLAPSLGEGFDFPLLEALSCGALVVASNIPVHVEHYSGAAALFESGNAEALAQVCLDVLADSDRAVALRRIARERASLFPWTTVGRRHLDLRRQVSGR